MRVISGNYRGRKLECVPGLEIRPTTDRVKENLFNIISPRLPYCRFLDLFSGSGSIGIEAISRGAEEVFFVDSDSESIKILKKNLETLKIAEHIKIFHSDAMDALNGFAGNQTFDIIYLDPPYNKGIYQSALKKIGKINILSEDGIIAVERNEHDAADSLPEELELVKEKKYGSTVLSFYQVKKA